MPELENLVVSNRQRSSPGRNSDSLAELEKSQLLQIFESAHDPDATFGIRPSSRLQSVLKEHQISALAMMIERECGSFDSAMFPTIWEPQLDKNGVKRWEMGLGKTLSAISLILWHLDSLESSKSNNQSRRPTLIITPKSTIPEWNDQFKSHVKPGHISVRTYHGSNRHEVAKGWEDADVVITTYDTLRSEYTSIGPLFKRAWPRVILDEAHNIRSRDSKVFRAATNIRASCRWCLTGTPIQNTLDDFGALLSFIRVRPFDNLSQFNYWIADPIKKRKDYAFKRLRLLVKATCLRRTKQSRQDTLRLPKKVEVNKVLDLVPGDRELYNFFKYQAATVAVKMEQRWRRKGSQRPKPSGGWGGGDGHILPLLGHLRRICDHGEDLLPDNAVRAWRDRDVDLVNWSMESPKCDSCHTDLEVVDGLASVDLACGHLICSNCHEIEDVDGTPTPHTSCRECSRGSPLSAPIQGGISGEYTPSVKIKALLKQLHREHLPQPGDEGGRPAKSVVFSCWTKMLDFIQRALQADGIRFQRIDGQTTLLKRTSALSAFRDDPDCRVMLASIGSVGEGVNLTVANHVHIMEPHWNPMVEAQAVDRVHRIGQQRDVSITRYLIKDSIESYVRGVQQDKIRLIQQSLSSTEIKQSDVDGQRFKKLLESLK
ncbi:related to helicase-like transcription factor protein [Cephalotrichum gorgonifer]|uniref:Related to helicase-like transcription factor protein n=1 Tax=Cephalotrichum gorgonifer TaxID=2041049 RepID=A0AAE8N824_9PEZI|nr:related to helicase-like transcription factor protein [Cephalotrichum gorgonifer]